MFTQHVQLITYTMLIIFFYHNVYYDWYYEKAIIAHL